MVLILWFFAVISRVEVPNEPGNLIIIADLFLYSYENEPLDNMIRSGHRRLARSFNLCYEYINDVTVFDNKKLTAEKTNKSDHSS